MNKSLWTAALAMMLLLAWGGSATATDYNVNGSTYPTLSAAVTAAGGTTGPSENANFNLTNPTPSDYGAGPGVSSGYYNFLGNQYNRVTITGNATNYYKLGFTSNATDARVFAFDNTATVNMTGLDIAGGNVARSTGLTAGGGTGGAALWINNQANPFAGVNLSNMKIHDNTTTITQSSLTDGFMATGAVLIDGGTAGTQASRGTVAFNAVELSGNKAIMRNGNTADVWSNASGGGARLVGISTLTYTGGVVSHNQALLQYGNHAVGGGLDIEAVNTSSATIDGTLFEYNLAEIQNEVQGLDRHHASGGAVYFYNGGDVDTVGTATEIKNAAFNNNEARAVNSVAQGGAVHYEGYVKGTIKDSRFEANRATTGEGHAQGGAVSIFSEFQATGNFSVDGVTFADNRAEGATAHGGGLYSRNSNIGIADSKFEQNIAKANNGNASGGGMSLGGTVNELNRLTVTGNRVEAKDATGFGSVYAQGGGIYAHDGQTTITDSVLTGNRASATSAYGTAVASGGAIFMNTGASSTATSLKLVSTSGPNGGVRIADNWANGKSSGIHFGAADGGVSASDGRLEIDAGGKVEFLDPVTVAVGTHNFYMTKTGNGDFTWDGVNTFDAAHTDINLGGGGQFTVGDKFTAKMTQAGSRAVVQIGDNTQMDFKLHRNATLAMFDFTGIGDTSKADFNIGNNVSIGADLGRELLSVDKRYLIASGLTVTEAQDAANKFIGARDVTSVYADNGRVYAGVRYDSPLDHAGENTDAVKNILAAMARDENLWTEAQLDLLRKNPWAVTPELFMSGATIMLNAADSVSRTAVNYGLIQPQRLAAHQKAYPGYVSDDAYGYAIDCTPTSGYRIWAGYIGDFDQHDATGAFDGYTVDRNGFLIGLNYDFGDVASVGVYGGYTRGELEAKRAVSTGKSNNGHVGVLARVTPIDALSFYADGGWHFGDTRMYRHLGGYHTDGSFNQDVLTAGLAIEYAYSVCGFNLVPYLKARYSHLYQGDLREEGFTANKVESFNDSAFNTRLGFEASYDIETESGVITPSVNVAWRREYGNRTFNSTAFLIEGPGYGSYNISSPRINRDSADIGAALRAAYELQSENLLGFNVGYNYNLSRRSSTHTVYAGFELGF